MKRYLLIALCAHERQLEIAREQPLGKLNFYLSAVDTQLRRNHDAPSIGRLLVKPKSRVFAEYALRDTTKPMGIAEYRLRKALPKNLEASLPSIAQIEAELAEPSGAPQTGAKTARMAKTTRAKKPPAARKAR